MYLILKKNMTPKITFGNYFRNLLTFYFGLAATTTFHTPGTSTCSFLNLERLNFKFVFSPSNLLVKSLKTSVSYFQIVLILILLDTLPPRNVNACSFAKVNFFILTGWVYLWNSVEFLMIGSIGLKQTHSSLQQLAGYTQRNFGDRGIQFSPWQ